MAQSKLTREQHHRRQELIAWRDRMQLSNRDAAILIGYSYSGFLNLIHGSRPVNPRALILARGIEAQRKQQKEPSQ